MTDELEKRALEIMAEVEKRGGMIQAIENGWVQEQIQDAAYKYQQAIEKGERVIVGVNRFNENGGGTVPVLKVAPALEKEQVQRLKAVKAQRDNRRVRKLLSVLEGAAREGANIMAPTLDAVRAYASVGEITNALRKVYGAHVAR
jgi:methylmalonyl-CoA mutase N-terminal domain/subunit